MRASVLDHGKILNRETSVGLRPRANRGGPAAAAGELTIIKVISCGDPNFIIKDDENSLIDTRSKVGGVS